MLSHYATRDIKNAYIAQLEDIQVRCDAEEISVTQVITPLELKEKQVWREIELLSLKIDMVNMAHAKFLEFTSGQLMIDSIYSQRLHALKDEFMAAFAIFLKAHNYYLSEKYDFIPVTKHNKPSLLQEYRTKIEQECGFHEQFQVKGSLEDIRQLSTDLTSTRSVLEKEHEELFAIKTRLTYKMQLRNTAYAEIKKQLDDRTAHHQMENSLPEAAARGDLECVKSLIQQQNFFSRKKYINVLGKDGFNALHSACNYGRIQIVEYLLNQGADLQVPDVNDRLALHHVVEIVNAHAHTHALIQCLIKAGAAINAPGPYKQTALHSAAYFGNLTAVKILVELGANVNLKESNEGSGRTPLHTACFKAHHQIVEYLLEHGANPRLLNAQNETPLVEALIYGNKTTAQVFFDEGIWLTACDRSKLREYPQYGAVAGYIIEVLEANARYFKMEMTVPSSVIAMDKDNHLSFHPGNNNFTYFKSAPNQNIEPLPKSAVAQNNNEMPEPINNLSIKRSG